MTKEQQSMTSEALYSKVKSSLFDPYNISTEDLNLMMSQMLSKGIDMGDIYFQNIHQESWTLEDGLVKKSSYSTPSISIYS